MVDINDRRRFDSLIGKILAHEGGYVNDPKDPGGETKYGISKRSYPTRDIKNLTQEEARDIYYSDWYLKLRLNQVYEDSIAQKILDTAINIGPKTCIQLLQRTLTFIGNPVVADGVMGPQTIAAINKANPTLLLAHLRDKQAGYYNQLIERNPELQRFRTGWVKRAYS